MASASEAPAGSTFSRLTDAEAPQVVRDSSSHPSEPPEALSYLRLFARYGDPSRPRDFGSAYLEPEDERYRLLFDQVCHLLVLPSAFNRAMPQEFVRTARLYLAGDAATLSHMRTAQMRHFMLSDLHDYVQLCSRMGQPPW